MGKRAAFAWSIDVGIERKPSDAERAFNESSDGFTLLDHASPGLECKVGITQFSKPPHVTKNA